MEHLKVLLVPIGSAGDVHPFIWLAKLLRSRGHDVVMIAQAGVAEMPQRAGVPTLPWGDAAEQEEIIRNPDIWHPRKALNLITKYSARWAAENISVIRGQIDPGRTLVLCGGLAFGARILREQTPVPLISVHLQPSIYMSLVETPVMVAGWEWLPKAPLWIRRLIFKLANGNVDRKLAPPINKVRHSLGLTGNVKGILRQYWHSPDGVISLFPDWFAPKQSDWPPQTVNTRFPLYDESGDRPKDPALEAFLAAGDPPIIITPGSANAHAADFIRQAVAATALLGRRALVITRFPEQVGTLPAGSASFEYVPFGEVFSRGAAVIHHGGIGTTAQCFAAGAPQLIMPMSHDQPDNANRVQRLGVGDYLYPKKFTAENIAKKLRQLTTSRRVRQACTDLQQRMSAQMPPQSVGELIEEMYRKAVAP